MTALATLSKRNLFPSLTSNLFDTGNLLNSRFWDLDGDFLNLEAASRIPSVNIRENGKDFKIDMAAPGLEKKDFMVEVDNGYLTISAEKKEEKSEEKENYTRHEYSYNSFSRSLRLPDNCLSDKIDAKYENGILHLVLPKKDVSVNKPVKQIKVA